MDALLYRNHYDLEMIMFNCLSLDEAITARFIRKMVIIPLASNSSHLIKDDIDQNAMMMMMIFESFFDYQDGRK